MTQSLRKVALVGSSGGHLLQLLALRPVWSQHDRFWVTFQKEDATSLLEGERTYWGSFPTNRNVRNLLRNTVLAWKVLRAEKPDVVVSTGAGLAIPFFVLARLFGICSVYLEVYDRLDSPTVTGQVCYRVASIFALQWEEQREFYPRGHLVGPVL